MNTREKDEVIIWAEKEIRALRDELRQLRQAHEDLLAAHRAVARESWGAVEELSRRVQALEGLR